MTDFRYISLGAGVQSSALLVMSALGLYDCPRADVAIFADTQDEPAYVYEYLEVLRDYGAKHGIRVDTVTAGKLSEEGTTKGGVCQRCDGAGVTTLTDTDRLFDTALGPIIHGPERVCPRCDGRGKVSGLLRIPGFTEGEDGRASMLRRQCTREFKIVPIQRHVRSLLGYQKRQRIKHKVEALIGISRDEIQRIRLSDEPWITNRYPLVDAGLYRGNCIEIVRRAGLTEPRKSACVFCPYHDDAYWRTLRDGSPEEFAKAADYDARIRDSSQAGVARPVFLHRSLKALRDVDFGTDATPQMDFGFQNECEGMCGV